MANSPQKRKADTVFDEPTTVSRSGRIRKPKVFYDPSEVVKRRSMPIVEALKPKKSTKLPEPELVPSPTHALITSIRPEPVELKKREIKNPYELKSPVKKVPVIEKPKPKAASIGNSRRKTVCVIASVYDDGGNGCIVCDRCDVKKGRFVNCIDCIKRGHFTCLRTEKLFKTADQEGDWQCPSCKICEFCNKSKPSVRFFLTIDFLASKFIWLIFIPNFSFLNSTGTTLQMCHLLKFVPFAMLEQNFTVTKKLGKKEVYLWLLYDGCKCAYQSD